MSFGVGTIDYKAVYSADPAHAIGGGPNDKASFNLAHLYSDAVATEAFGSASATEIGATPGEQIDTNPGPPLKAGKSYVMTSINAEASNTTDLN